MPILPTLDFPDPNPENGSVTLDAMTLRQIYLFIAKVREHAQAHAECHATP